MASGLLKAPTSRGGGASGDSGEEEPLPGDEQRQELTEHLAELRTRIIRAVVYIVGGMVAMWWLFPILFGILVRPVTDALREVAKRVPPDQQQLVGRLVFHNFFEPFFLRLQLSLVSGLIVAAPLIVLELWGFVTPGLTIKERRSVRFVAPFSVFLFLLGASIAYLIMPAAVHWFLLYLTDFPNAILLQDPQEYILFLVKMVLAFGLVFQLPVLLMGLAKFGIIRSWMLTKYWRYIVVGITAAAMVITPSNDPLSMTMMAVPLVVLFFGSIWLVRLVEPPIEGEAERLARR